MKVRFKFLIGTLSFFLIGIISTNAANQNLIAAQFEDKNLFLSAIKQVREHPSTESITGLTVPHHLLARDLIAKAFNFAARGKYQKILLLSPDHFNLGNSDISIASKNFASIFGELNTDRDAVNRLKQLPFVSEENFFYREHGIQAELPFIKYYFPAAKIIVLTFKTTCSKDKLDKVVAQLEQALTPDTLVIQSTDFSHYLSPQQAKTRDRQTMNVLSYNDPDKLFSLSQPKNIDSIAAQYLQSRLQKEFFHSKLYFVAHKNSQDYSQEKISSSTSYFVHVYLKDPATFYKDSSIILVGDIMLSRGIEKIMQEKNDYNFPFARISDFLHSSNLVVGNLETPISNRGESSGNLYSFRAEPRVVIGLKNAGFSVLSLANNHIFDYGKEALVDTLHHLKKAGIDYVGVGMNFSEAHQGVTKEINGTEIAFLSYTNLLLKNAAAKKNSPGISYLDPEQMVSDIVRAKKNADLVIVSFHFGQEYQTKHSLLQEQIAKKAIEAGACLVVGHHPHVVQEIEKYRNGYIAYSLGNFVFDQNFSPETRVGLVLKVEIQNKKIAAVIPYRISFDAWYQPVVSSGLGSELPH
jgi:AmmeMemoRadiSam system protein B